MLEPGETIVYKAKIHRFCYVMPGLLLAIGLLLTFPPPLPSSPRGPLQALEQNAGAMIDTIKLYIPNRILPYVETFQVLRKNYIGLLLIVLGGARLIYAFAYRNLSRYWVTNKRILSQTLIFQHYIQDIDLARLARVRIYYGLLGKQLRRGRVVINDTGMQEIELKHINHPEKYRLAILAAAKPFHPRPTETTR